VDGRGHLVVTHALRELFVYFLTATGEEPDAVISARVVAALDAAAPEPAAGEARRVFDRYLAWRRAAAERLRTGAGGSPGEQLGALKESRRAYFNEAEVRAFWGEEEALADAAWKRKQALDTAAERGAPVPGEFPSSPQEREALAVVRHAEEEAQLRAQGATDEDIQQARRMRYGIAAAERLEALDRAHAQWDARVEAYLRDRAALVENGSLTDAERAQAMNRLREARFSPTERLRLQAIESAPRD
jgi:lipase chaperone LimK